MADADPKLGHWATWKGKALADEMLRRFKKFESDLEQRDLKRMNLAWRTYYGEDDDGYTTADVGRTGSKDQIRVLKDNEFRSILQNKLTMVTNDPPGFLPVPVNGDAASQKASTLTRGVIDYYFDDKDIDAEAADATEEAELLGWSWVDLYWNKRAGPPSQLSELGGVDGMPIQDEQTGDVDGIAPPPPAGDLEAEKHLAIDVAFEMDARRPKSQWEIIRYWRNRFDLAAEVEAAPMAPDAGPEDDPMKVAERIRLLLPVRRGTVEQVLRGLDGSDSGDPDEVPVFELRHRATSAVPGGRVARLVGDDIFLKDEAWPYGDDPLLYRVKAAKRIGTPRAYTSAHDMLGLAKAVDVLTSIPYSNQAALGVNILWSQTGKEMTVTKVNEGLMHVQTPSDQPPVVLALAQTKPEIFSFRDTLKRDMAGKAGLDALSMGREERTLPGNAMALLDSRTQRSVSKLAKEYTRLRQNIANGIIRLLRTHAKESRKIPMLVGKNKRPALQEFTSEDFAGIDRVKCETISPLMRTPAGRLEVGMQAAQLKNADGTPGLTPEQFFGIVEYGKYEQLTDGPLAELNTIREENERLMAGEVLDTPQQMDPLTGQPIPPPPGAEVARTAVMYDNPLKHIMEHRVAFASSYARRSPEILANAAAHMEAHIPFLMQWISGDPLMVAMHGPPPQMPMPAAPGGEPGASGGGPPGAPPQLPGAQPSQPAMPTNPSTGQEYSPTGDVSNG